MRDEHGNVETEVARDRRERMEIGEARRWLHRDLARNWDAEAEYQRLLKILADHHNEDQVWWYQAPLPRRWHKCSPWSSAWINLFDRVERCACGAIRWNGGTWHEKNSRRKQ